MQEVTCLVKTWPRTDPLWQFCLRAKQEQQEPNYPGKVSYPSFHSVHTLQQSWKQQGGSRRNNAIPPKAELVLVFLKHCIRALGSKVAPRESRGQKFWVPLGLHYQATKLCSQWCRLVSLVTFPSFWSNVAPSLRPFLTTPHSESSSQTPSSIHPTVFDSLFSTTVFQVISNCLPSSSPYH